MLGRSSRMRSSREQAAAEGAGEGFEDGLDFVVVGAPVEHLDVGRCISRRGRSLRGSR